MLNRDRAPDFASLVSSLAEAICETIDIIVDSEGRLRDNVVVSVNSCLVRPSDFAKLIFSNGGVIDTMPLQSGG